MRAADLVVGEAYAYGSRQTPERVTYKGHLMWRTRCDWRLRHVGGSDFREYVDQTAARYHMTWSDWKASHVAAGASACDDLPFSSLVK